MLCNLSKVEPVYKLDRENKNRIFLEYYYYDISIVVFIDADASSNIYLMMNT